MAGPSDQRGEVLRRFYALSEADRLEVVREISEYLELEPAEETDVERVVLARREALQDLRRAAEHLRAAGVLGDSESPTVKQFDQAAKELDLEWNRSRIIRAFGTWRNAGKALLGDRVAESPAQRRLRQLSARGRARTHEDHLTALRAWLDIKPRRTLSTDYNAWAKTQQRIRPDAKPLPSPYAVASGLGLPWAACVEAATAGLSFEQARREYAEQQTRGLKAKSLIGVGLVAALVAIRSQYVPDLVLSGRLAPPVARVSTADAWFYEDVKACRDGAPAPKRGRGEYQSEIYDTAAMCRAVGRDKNYARTLINKGNWRLIPEPSGMVGRHHYWLRRDVAEWQKRRVRARGKASSE